MKRQSFATKRRARRRGTVMYFVAGALVMLLGCAALAVDYGVLVNDKNYLQRLCDASALGGATKLTDTNEATRLAQLVAGQNRFADDDNNDMSITFLENNRQIRVEAVRRRSLFFARVMGQTEGVVRAHAIATVSGETPDIVPIGITTTSYNTENPIVSGTRRRWDTQASPTFTTKLINRQKEPFDPSDFILFDMRPAEGKSAEHMRRQLAGIEELDVAVGDVAGAINPPEATAVNANVRTQGDFFSDGMTIRFQAAAGSPWFDIDPNQGTNYLNYEGQHYDAAFNGTEPLGNGQPFLHNPRIMSFIVTPPVGTTTGVYNAPIVDLATVYVTKVYHSGGELLMDYRYLPSTSGGGGSGRLVE